MAKQAEMEKVTVELPKAVMDFLRKFEANPQEYLQYSLLAVIKSDLDASEGGVWPSKSDIESILEASENS